MKPYRRSPTAPLAAALVAGALLLPAFLASGQQAPPPAEPAGEGADAAAEVSLVAVPQLDLDAYEPAVGRQLREVQAALDALLARAGGEGASPPSAAEVAAGFGDLGRHFHAYGLTEAAAACYRNAAVLAPQDARWPHLLGRALQQAGRLPEATEAYRRALELAPDDLPAHVYLAEIRALQGDAAAAVEHYREAVALDPRSPAALAGLGQAALDAGDAAEAVERLEAALAAQPAADRLRYPLGLAYRALGDEEKARQNLLAAGDVGVRPQDPLVDGLEDLKSGERVHLLRGHMAYRAGRFGEAADAYHRAVDAAPDSVPARVDLATALSRLGYLEGAEEQLRHALDRRPDAANVHYNLGALLAMRGDRAGAGVHLRRALSLDPDDGAAHLALAETLADGPDARPEEAIAHYRRAAELGLRDDQVYLGEVAIHYRTGDWAAALERLEAGFAAVPESVNLLSNLARLLAINPHAELRDGVRAYELGERAYAAQRSVVHATTLAAALGEQGRCEEAAEWQGKAIAALEGQAAQNQADELRPVLEIYRQGPPCRYPTAAAPAGAPTAAPGE